MGRSGAGRRRAGETGEKEAEEVKAEKDSTLSDHALRAQPKLKKPFPIPTLSYRNLNWLFEFLN